MTEAWGVLLVPLIVGLVEVAKRSGLPVRWAPLLAVALGLGVAGVVSYRRELGPALLWGLALGLAACGLYSGARTVRRG